MESVRKDVECFFGILKQRFRWLWGYNFSQSHETITMAFKCACILHNIILEYDRASHEEMRRWENVDWSAIDPNMSEEDFVVAEPAPDEDTVELELPFLSDPLSSEGAIVLSSDSTYDYDKLKSMLISSFHVQFRLGQVYWPKRFQGWQRDCLALQRIIRRISHECRNALYARLSSYVTERNEDIGEGLFSTIKFHPNDCIAEFHRDGDESINEESYLQLVALGLARFVVKIKNDVYWDCRLNRYAGVCMASISNSPLGLKNRETGRQARANCELRVSGSEDAKVAKLVATTVIEPHTEILWHYGAGHVIL